MSEAHLGTSKRFMDVPEFAGLPNHLLEKLMKQLHSSVFADGQKLCVEGRGSTKIMMVENGFVDCAIPKYLVDMKVSKEELLKSLGISVDLTPPPGKPIP